MGKRLIVLLVLCFLIVFSSVAYAASVYSEKGNIYYSDGKIKAQLTNSGTDRAPVLSPDGKVIVFIRKSTGLAYAPTGGGDDGVPGLADQIWRVDIEGKNEKMLVKDNDPDVQGPGKWRGEDVVRYIQDDSLQFSPDGKTLYYLTAAWVTSSALRAVNIDGTNDHFIAGANYLKVIDKGEYKGNLVISDHRYFRYGGSYDWVYIFTPEGKEIAPLAEDIEGILWEELYSEDWEKVKGK